MAWLFKWEAEACTDDQMPTQMLYPLDTNLPLALATGP